MKPGQMGFMEFLRKHCYAHGGNWIAMLLSGKLLDGSYYQEQIYGRY